MSPASALADYLLNAVWQVPLFLGAAHLLAPQVRRLGPLAEHRLWAATLLAECVLPGCPATGVAPAMSAALRHATAWCAGLFGGVPAVSSVTVAVSGARPVGHSAAAVWAAEAAVVVYAAVLAVLALRFVRQLQRLRALRQEAEPVELPAEDARFVRRACAALGIGAEVEVAASTAASTPLTFGLRRPVLLLPRGFAAQVSRPQMHAALAHELAHVARRDAAKHLLYRVVAMPIAFHPAALLTMGRLMNTREQICDRLAAELLDGPRLYARTLLELSSLLSLARPAPLHAVGIFDGQHLERRIVMLQRPISVVSRTRRLFSIACTGVAGFAVCSSAVALHRDAGVAAEVRPATGGQTTRVPAGVMAAQVVHRVQPVYPAEAKQAKISGAVLLNAVIGKTGAIDDLSVISGPEELRQSALDAVRQWVYQPYLVNGEPTQVQTTITVRYSFGESNEPPVPQGAAEHAAASEAPKLLSQVLPVYPAAARRAKVGGEVVVGMKVGTDGRVSDVAALSGPEELRAAATDAAKGYVFAPAVRNGQPVPVDLQVAIRFQVF